MLGILCLGVGSDMSQRKFPKDDVTDGYGEVTQKNDFYHGVSRGIFAFKTCYKIPSQLEGGYIM